MGRRKKGDPVTGWVIVDKPSGPTSTDVVNRVRRHFNARKAGHAGTLDPLATGLLPVAMGEATKTIPFIMDADKGYLITIRFGVETASADAEGAVVAQSDVRPSDGEIRDGLEAFRGEIEQVPPIFSAIKVNGERAYDLARAGEEVELKSRRVTIHEIHLVSRPDPDQAVVEILCSKGTYARSLARDLARHLGTVGHVAALRRTRHGPFSEEDGIPLDKLLALSHYPAASEALRTHLLPLETALDDIPAVALSDDDVNRLRHGQEVLLRGRDAPILSGPVLATHRGNPVALTEFDRGSLRPVRVFNFE